MKGPAITEEGVPCRHCGTPVVWKFRKNTDPRRQDQQYYFSQWLRCPNKKCKALYMDERYKRYYHRMEKPVAGNARQSRLQELAMLDDAIRESERAIREAK